MDYHVFTMCFPPSPATTDAVPPRPDPSASPPALAAPAKSSAAEGPRPRPSKRPRGGWQGQGAVICGSRILEIFTVFGV